MSTFDTSTAPRHGTELPPPDAAAETFTPGAPPPVADSLLDQLRERVAERDAAEPDEWFKVIPGVGIRLVCDLNIEADDFQRWLKAAQSRKGGRRQGVSSAVDLSPFALSVRALTATCLRLEIRDGESWRPMVGTKGDTLGLDSKELLQTFGVMDAGSVLRKLFGRDSRVIDAGQELLAAAGYTGDEDGDENPE